MNNQIRYFIIFSVLASCISAQLISQLPNQSPGTMITGSNSSEPLPLFDPSRFSMNHSFSMSAMNVGNQMINVAAYTNMMNYTLNPNLHIGASFSLIQPTGMQNPLSYGVDKHNLYTMHIYDINQLIILFLNLECLITLTTMNEDLCITTNVIHILIIITNNKWLFYR